RLEDDTQGFLGRGLANAAGDANDKGTAASAGGAGEIDQPAERVGNGDAAWAGAAADEGSGSAIGKGSVDEVVAIEAVALDGDEERVRADLTGIDGDGADGIGFDPFGGSACRFEDRVEGEQRLGHGVFRELG